MELFDSHSHYNDEQFDLDREDVIKRVYNSGVTKLITAGYSLESSKKAVEIANGYDFIYAIVGISPNDIDGIPKNYLEQIENLAKTKKVVAIGEIGLDYHWSKENKDKQQEIFIKQIELANKLELPIVVHTRDAIMDTIDVLKNRIRSNKNGVIHCCSFNENLVQEMLKLGFYLSFAGPVTYENVTNAKKVIEKIPMDRLLIETDSPYLTPEPVRGSRNNPSNVRYIAQKIAEIKEVSVEEVAKRTYENAKKIFEIE